MQAVSALFCHDSPVLFQGSGLMPHPMQTILLLIDMMIVLIGLTSTMPFHVQGSGSMPHPDSPGMLSTAPVTAGGSQNGYLIMPLITCGMYVGTGGCGQVMSTCWPVSVGSDNITVARLRARESCRVPDPKQHTSRCRGQDWAILLIITPAYSLQQSHFAPCACR
jgi:hypothetical protein